MSRDEYDHLRESADSARDPLWPNGGRPLCRQCGARPVYLGGLCGSCYAAAGRTCATPDCQRTTVRPGSDARWALCPDCTDALLEARR